ncbi:MAG: hypothetical protein FWD25_09155 [Clostridia bacterium]|nr:hypothetical protein [Clostridia bacterium]
MSFFERLQSLPRHKPKKELDAHFEKMQLEKGDMFAMILAGFMALWPILLILGITIGLTLLFFRAI